MPREAAAGLERRLRAVDEKVREVMDSAWRRTSRRTTRCWPRCGTQVAEAEERLARAQAAGDARRIKEAEQALASKRQFLQLAEQAG